jgi:hypothetical protein
LLAGLESESALMRALPEFEVEWSVFFFSNFPCIYDTKF